MIRWSREKQRPPVVIRGQYHFGYGGDIKPENVTISQYYDLTSLKRSNVRITDQLIPSPTEINLSEKQIAVPTQREHPFQSHIPRFAMFPSFCSPDDPDIGVRAAQRNPLNPLIPGSIPDVFIRSKTMGAPYRHEVLKVPTESSRKALSWPGQHGFYHYPKSTAGTGEVFYPTPIKTICPNPSLRPSDITLSERKARILQNMEQFHWLTSYQLDFTGSGPMNPVKLDDFTEKTVALVTDEDSPYTGQLRERSHPEFRPSRPLSGRKARILQRRRLLQRNSPSFLCLDDCRDLPPTTIRPAVMSSGGPHSHNTESHRSALIVEHLPGSGWEFAPNHVSEATGQDQRPGTEVQPCNMCGCRTCVCQKSVDGPSLVTDQHRPQESTGSSSATGLSKAESKSPAANKMEGRGFPNHSSGSHRCRTLLSPSKAVETPLPSHQSALLKLQDSFSKTEAHRRFHQDFQGGTVDLRDNVCKGRRHQFFGLNSYYFH